LRKSADDLEFDFEEFARDYYRHERRRQVALLVVLGLIAAAAVAGTFVTLRLLRPAAPSPGPAAAGRR
jgi:uncharacterized membrane protein